MCSELGCTCPPLESILGPDQHSLEKPTGPTPPLPRPPLFCEARNAGPTPTTLRTHAPSTYTPMRTPVQSTRTLRSQTPGRHPPPNLSFNISTSTPSKSSSKKQKGPQTSNGPNKQQKTGASTSITYGVGPLTSSPIRPASSVNGNGTPSHTQSSTPRRRRRGQTSSRPDIWACIRGISSKDLDSYNAGVVPQEVPPILTGPPDQAYSACIICE
jgi:hypothetical protein